jgi:hypothetical protein
VTWHHQPSMAHRKIIPKKEMQSREHLRITPKDIVRAIDGVTAAGLQVYAVEITPTGAINISIQPPPHQAVPDKQISAKPDETKPDDPKTRQKTSLAILMNSDVRGVLIALIIVIVTFAIGIAGHL